MITYEEYEKALIERHTEKVHNMIKFASVAISGLGGLGSNIAIYLARAGVGHLHLVDFDRVDITNLNRQQYNICDVGTLKTDALTNNIKRFNPFIKITSECVKVTEDNVAEIFGEYNIVCEAFDRAENKAMLVNTLLAECRDTKIVSGSGMAGIESSNLIKTQKINSRFYLCGDTKNEVNENVSLIASRVAICAAHQANMVIRLIIGNEDE